MNVFITYRIASRGKMCNYGIPGCSFDLWSYTFATAYGGLCRRTCMSWDSVI